MNLNTRSCGDGGRGKFVAIVNMLVGVVRDTHLNTQREAVDDIPDHSPDHKRICRHTQQIPRYQNKNGEVDISSIICAQFSLKSLGSPSFHIYTVESKAIACKNSFQARALLAGRSKQSRKGKTTNIEFGSSCCRTVSLHLHRLNKTRIQGILSPMRFYFHRYIGLK